MARRSNALDFSDPDAGAAAFTSRQYSVAQALHARLQETIWAKSEGGDSFGAVLCALIVALDPTVNVARIVDALPPENERFGAADVLNALAFLGFKGSRCDTGPNTLDPRLTPCLALNTREEINGRAPPLALLAVDYEDGQPVVTYIDGRTGALEKASPDDLANAGWRVAFTFTSFQPDEAATSGTRRGQTGQSWFQAIIGRFRPDFLRLIAIGIALSFVSLGVPLFVMLVYDRVIGPRAADSLDYLAAGVVLAGAMEWFLRGLRSRCLSWLATRLDFIVGAAIFERLMGLPPAFLERASAASQIARLKTFEAVRDFFSGPVFMSLIEMPSIVISFTVLAYFGGVLSLVPVVIATLHLVVFWIIRRKVAASIRTAARATSRTQQFAIETFEKLETIKSNGLAEAWSAKYRDLSGRENMAQFRLFVLGSLGEALAQALTLLAALATLTVGVSLVWSGDVSAGVLVASMILTWRVLGPFQSLCATAPRFEQLRNAIIQINNLMDVATEDETDKVSARPLEIKGGVSFVNASMRYSKEGGAVFLGLNLEIEPGSIVAITGANGSGKTSVLQLVQGLYSPASGVVRIDGFDIRQLVQRDLRRMIGYVPQNPEILAGTVAENLRVGQPLAAEDELWRALEDVGAAEEIRQLPGGLSAKLDSRNAAHYSAALPYRIAFARALLQNSNLLLVDEQPNAVLNAGFADLLRRIVAASRGRRTVIFVSHRVDLMRMADRVIRLRRGHVPAHGPLDLFLEEAA